MGAPKIQVSRLFDETLAAMQAGKRIVVHEGGARSSKTYSIAQFFILLMAGQQGRVLSVVRKSGVALKGSAERDMVDIMNHLGLYSPENHRLTFPREYALNGNLVEFLGMDSAQKKRGAKRDWLWCNEANELLYDDYLQLALRTSELIVMDYNPSDEYHWIYERVLTRDDCVLIKSTYRDNPCLDPAVREEIERLESTDETAWRVFGLGERASYRGKIYTNWVSGSSWPAHAASVYGLDFGFNNPTALVELAMHDGEMFVRERIYQSGLTNSDLVREVRALGITGAVYCDAAEPQRIEELRRAGIHAVAADKSVSDGIDYCQRHRIHVVDSPSLEREIRSYKWRETRDGHGVDEPVKYNDHALDAMRYAAYTHWGKATGPIGYRTIKARETAWQGAF